MSSLEPPPDWLLTFSSEEAAAKLGVSAKSLQRSARRGDAPIPFFYWGRTLRWPGRPLWRFLQGLPPLEDAPAEPDCRVTPLRRVAR